MAAAGPLGGAAGEPPRAQARLWPGPLGGAAGEHPGPRRGCGPAR